MFENALNLTSSVVSVVWQTSEPDGMGGWILTDHEQGFPKAAMWSPGQSASYVSDAWVSISSHILVTLPSYHDWDGSETAIKYKGLSYSITGTDNIMNRDEIMMVGLSLVTP